MQKHFKYNFYFYSLVHETCDLNSITLQALEKKCKENQNPSPIQYLKIEIWSFLHQNNAILYLFSRGAGGDSDGNYYK